MARPMNDVYSRFLDVRLSDGAKATAGLRFVVLRTGDVREIGGGAVESSVRRT